MPKGTGRPVRYCPSPCASGAPRPSRPGDRAEWHHSQNDVATSIGTVL